MPHRSSGVRLISALVIAAGAVAGGASRLEAGAGSEPPASSVPAASSEAASSEAAASAPASGEWEQIVPGGDCQCADGSEFSFFVRKADPTKVVLFLEGGGACFSAETCAFTDEESTTYNWRIGPFNHPDQAGGIFELDNAENPFADYSMVFVPYCTGDVHVGNATTEYSPDLTVEHNGAVNGAAALAYLADEFPDAEQVVVVGESAGAAGSPLYGGLVSDALPDADVVVFADGSGGYPDQPDLNEHVGGGLWGTMNVVPDWEVNEGMTAAEWSLPGLWVQAGTHDPEIVMSRFDFAFDEAQVFFASLNGIEASELLEFMDDNEARIEAAGVDQASFTAPGNDHTLVRKPEFYEMEVNGVRLVDWVADLVAGTPVPDVHCTDCEAPPTTG